MESVSLGRAQYAIVTRRAFGGERGGQITAGATAGHSETPLFLLVRYETRRLTAKPSACALMPSALCVNTPIPLS